MNEGCTGRPITRQLEEGTRTTLSIEGEEGEKESNLSSPRQQVSREDTTTVAIIVTRTGTMKFSTAALLLVVAPTSQAFQPMVPQRTTSTSTSLFSTTEEEQQQDQMSAGSGSGGRMGMSKKKEDRLNFMKSDRFHRRGFKEVRDKVESAVQEQFQSSLVDNLKSSNYVIEKDGVKVYLAKVRERMLYYI